MQVCRRFPNNILIIISPLRYARVTAPTHQVEDFALEDELMQAPHHFLDTCLPIPPVDVEQIDIGCAQLLERGVD